MGLLLDYMTSLLLEQVKKNHIVVWFDPDKWYSGMVESLDLPGVTVAQYQGSFFALRQKVEPLIGHEEPPDLVLYVPMAEEDSLNALAELSVAGIVMRPGQNPWQRNTRPSLVAKNAVINMGDKAMAESVELQVRAGKLSFYDVDQMMDRSVGGGGDAIIAAIFRTMDPIDVALTLLGTPAADGFIVERNCLPDVAKFLERSFGVDLCGCNSLQVLRESLARTVLAAEFISALRDRVPRELATAIVATEPELRERQVELVRLWRVRRDLGDSYAEHSARVERELGVASLDLEIEQLRQCTTFTACERMLQSAVERRLVQAEQLTETELKSLHSTIDDGLQGFWAQWSENYPDIKLRWQIIRSASTILHKASAIENSLRSAPLEPWEMIDRYVGVGRTDPWCLLDAAHRDMRRRWLMYDDGLHRGSESLGRLVSRAGRRYMEAGDRLAEAFTASLERGKLAIDGYLPQSNVFSQHVAPALATGKTGYVLVDSLRYEMARELAEELHEEFEVQLEAAVSAVPTVTEIGMAALMPGAESGVRIVSTGSSRLAAEVSGTLLKDRKDRMAFARGRIKRTYEDKLSSLFAPAASVKRAMEDAALVMITSEEIDAICESSTEWAAREAVQSVLRELPRAFRALGNAGCTTIVVTADHGHLFLEELSSGMKIDPPGGEVIQLRRRVWVGRGGEDCSHTCIRTRLNGSIDLEIVVPRGFGAFKAAGGGDSYFHGGLSLPEMIIPVMVLRPKDRSQAIYTQTAVTWHMSLGSAKVSAKVITVNIGGDITALFAGDPPRVRVELVQGDEVQTMVIAATYGLAESSGEIAMRFLGGEQRQLEPNTITLKLNEELANGPASVRLVDAVTGVTLSALDDLIVDIAR